ncbi:MAG TPA: lysylphosphatidylglycerol synthase transmembrane domain-containing protein [Phycisphaerae bacterium]|nr:lysylphosphatidylglycerol synthase transmembrane domain-containing protein [Phycisphaerae bacterium]HRW55160.1 lysylphosphatidylglycerol synthase transmembrane domain-containing protein [Phycisphaerae bacterium]
MTEISDNSTLMEPDRDASDESKALRRKRLFRVVKWLTILVVLAAMGWQISKLADDWGTDGAKVFERSLAWGWLAAAMVFFWAGQFCFSLYWRRLLLVSDVSAPLVPSVRAYLVGTLGKYMPGKALVVVVRTGMLPDAKGKRFLVGGVTIYETLTSMSAAGLIGVIAMLVTRQDLIRNMLGAASIAIALSVIVHPTAFGRLAKMVAIPFRRKGDPLPVRDWYRCYWRSAPLLLCEWLGSGLSLWATAAAFHLDVMSFDAVLFLTGVAALATAAGFLVLPVPAGIGVREFIVISLLTKWFGEHATAVCISLVLRTLWTAGEILLAGGLYLLPGVTWARAKMSENGVSAASS